jgi:imidazolonepropionase-like amidohydrolase
MFFVIISARAQDSEPSQLLFVNVNVFNGTDEELIDADVLVEGNLIKEIGQNLQASGATIVDGGGRTLMPGIIEGHNHLMLSVDTASQLNTHDVYYVGAAAAAEAEGYLMRGWTTVRDTGGPAEGLRRAIDDGRVVGPRIYNSGPVIGQTAGHGDFRQYNDPHPNWQEFTQPFYSNFSFIADGPAEVRQAVRETLRRGSVHVKVMAGGGVSSITDPLYTVQYSPEEMRAAVEAAADYGAYVLVHAYNDTSIIRSVEAGVKVIEHGTLMTEKSAKVMKKNGTWISPSCQVLNLPEEAVSFLSPDSREKFYQAKEGLDRQMELIQEYDLKIAFGTDMFGNAENFEATPKEFSCREKYFTPAEVLIQATGRNGELLAMTGKRDPYPAGPIGVIRKGAYADLLLVDGNPLEGTAILEDYENNIDLIMKDGVIYKNTL